MTTFINQPKTPTGLTWDEATMTWNQAEGTWDYSNDFTPQTKNTTTFTNQSKNSGQTFADVVISNVAPSTFNDAYEVIPIKDRTFNDVVGTLWANQTKN